MADEVVTGGVSHRILCFSLFLFWDIQLPRHTGGVGRVDDGRSLARLRVACVRVFGR